MSDIFPARMTKDRSKPILTRLLPAAVLGLCASLSLFGPPLLERCGGVDHRPLLGDQAGFLRLLEERRPEYRKADFKVETDGVRPEQVVEDILRLPFF